MVKNFEENNFSIYDITLSVLNKTILGTGITWDNLQEVFGNPDVDDGDVGTFEGPEALSSWDRWGFFGNQYRTLLGDHHGFIFAVGGNSDGFAKISPTTSEATITSASITLGATTTIETEFHHFLAGDKVTFRNVEGTTELNGLTGTITSVTDQSTIVVDIDSSGFTAYTGSGEVVKIIDFQAEFVPFNPYRSKGDTAYLGKMDLCG